LLKQYSEKIYGEAEIDYLINYWMSLYKYISVLAVKTETYNHFILVFGLA